MFWKNSAMHLPTIEIIKTSAAEYDLELNMLNTTQVASHLSTDNFETHWRYNFVSVQVFHSSRSHLKVGSPISQKSLETQL